MKVTDMTWTFQNIKALKILLVLVTHFPPWFCYEQFIFHRKFLFKKPSFFRFDFSLSLSLSIGYFSRLFISCGFIVNLSSHNVLFCLSPFSIWHCDTLRHLRRTEAFLIASLLLFGFRLSGQCDLLASLPLATKPLFLMAIVSYVPVTSFEGTCTHDAISHVHIRQEKLLVSRNISRLKERDKYRGNVFQVYTIHSYITWQLVGFQVFKLVIIEKMVDLWVNAP